MAKRSSKKTKKDHDFAVNAFRVFQQASGTPEPEESSPEEEPDIGDKNPHAVALGRLGGKKGGKARAKKLTPEQRSEIAKKAIAARWGNS
jgi:hypothetical protein